MSQNYPNLEYIVIDGGSTDGSVEVIKRYADKITYWVSEPDKGMYQAVQKGFEKSTGEIMAWINSDDYYVDNAFEIVAEVFNRNPEIDWIRGLPLEDLGNGEPVDRFKTPLTRWSKYRYLTYDFQFIQQESSFWRRSLWEASGGKMDSSVKYAGDMELWARFFRYEKLYTIDTYLAVFRHRNRQISKEHLTDYLVECKAIIKRELSKLGTGKRIEIFFMHSIRWFWGIFYFLNIPVLRVVYEGFFRLPKLVRVDSHPKSNYRKSSRFVFPPIIIGRWVMQRKILKLKP